MKKLLALVPLCALVISCASFKPTPYQPLDENGGYSELALNKDSYSVTFQGNEETGRERVENYALRRSAELTLRNGYKYFVKVAGGTREDLSTHTTPEVHTKSKDPLTGEKKEEITPAETHTHASYTTKMQIKMLMDNVKHPNAFDAEMVAKNFG